MRLSPPEGKKGKGGGGDIFIEDFTYEPAMESARDYGSSSSYNQNQKRYVRDESFDFFIYIKVSCFVVV